MADIPISQLPAYTTVSGVDLIPVVDVLNGATKKATIAQVTSLGVNLTGPITSVGPATSITDSAIKKRSYQSGIYNTAVSNDAGATITSTSFDSGSVLTGYSVTVTVDVTSDVEIRCNIYSLQSSLGGANSIHLGLFRGATQIGAGTSKDMLSGGWNAGVNNQVQFIIMDMNLAPGTYTYQVKAHNNSAATITYGSGEISARVNATGNGS